MKLHRCEAPAAKGAGEERPDADDGWACSRRDNLLVLRPEASRKRIARTLSAAYADGLLSEDTFVDRLEHLLKAPLVYPRPLVGDISLRPSPQGLPARLRHAANAAIDRIGVVGRRSEDQSTLLALDWSGKQEELLVGRDEACHVVLEDLTVSRRHARLLFRAGSWIVQDLHSANGIILNGEFVGRSELRPGDRLILGCEVLTVD